MNEWLMEAKYPPGTRVRIKNGMMARHTSGKEVDFSGITATVIDTTLHPTEKMWVVGIKLDKVPDGFDADQDTADMLPDQLEII